MDNILEVQKLKKTFYETKLKNWKFKKVKTEAVKNISFSLKKGEILGLLGPNGAGKTTTIQMLLGALTPTQGKISYFGKVFNGEDPEILKRINFSSAYIELPWRMSVWENLDVYGRIYEVPDRQKRILKLLNRFGILQFKDSMMRKLSAGQTTRVVLAKAFLNYPEVILLDEPTASLDPDIAKQIREFLLEQQKEYGVSMLFTSHNMKEVQEVCDRVIFINHGEIVAEDTPLGLLKKFRETRVRMLVKDSREKLEKYLHEKGYHSIWKKGKVIITLAEDKIPVLLYRISELGVKYQDLEVIRPDLEDFFLSIAEGEKK
ncbi:hypothetical protein A2X44_02335 [candidate division CPR3 bacterium GWF2_35_18]|uniref:ABC transporter, ATPase subunit n=1 Tax=candidate division CPR3 bacterium GW2011_GWF2_35_18 TaxID=1618350 RepID=A0A0G0E3W9_UNCC3|nr:MAG: ABC transporter, ATPase subunit [candidate division CPR3 bacterium GW2011_GWF2_35_18]KKP86596.1 MAG: ABC transporter, ATPase subunit [candidate division CPR3 bacterium GW2011_GWE2_35_7]OGB62833.1 MAG: hypothetical protein A2X44_02335 [candidate division CPR3 bacterium GWF2_35_18]OGB65414.1 MAG: hypothetical protein A2250_00550 [candidate division CPR3 bacterium RIFOXYA2_FULL_35_13]OGB76845.1 MAG: hypothetical protein A2476_04200 [candidate division CPR3 bacterium RIFOXYC2_FULL_35_7]OGB